MHVAKELLEAIQSEAEFDNVEIEKSIIELLELLQKDLVYVQYEMSSDVEAAIVNMNKVIAKANTEIAEDIEEDDDDEEEDLLELDDEDDEEEDEEPLEHPVIEAELEEESNVTKPEIVP
jgi:hypothetical protein